MTTDEQITQFNRVVQHRIDEIQVLETSGIPSFYIAHKISFQTPCCSSKEVNNVIN